MAWLIKHTLNPVLQYSCDLWTIYFLDTRSYLYVHTRERWPFYFQGTDTRTLNGPNVSNQISKIACGFGIKRPLTPSLLFFAPTGIKTAKWCAPKSYFGTPETHRVHYSCWFMTLHYELFLPCLVRVSSPMVASQSGVHSTYRFGSRCQLG